MSEVHPYPVPVEAPKRFEGPLHRKAIRALADEALYHAHTEGILKEARTDHLTQLGNRKAFEEVMTERLLAKQTGQDGDPLALVFIDLDKFKYVNDELGHKAGDNALKDVSAIISRILSVRQGEEAFRIGGDEFVIIARPINYENDNRDKSLTSEEILEGLGKRVKTEVSEIARLMHVDGFGASVGYALYEQSDTMETLLERADQAMYAQKAESRA